MLKSISKKMWIVIGIAAAALITAILVLFYLKQPVGYISIDVNPGIEIQTNRLGEVVAVKAANADGEAVLKGYKPSHDLEDVIEDVVDRMVLTGYLNTKEETPILITVDGKSIDKDFQQRLNTDLKKALEARKILAGILNNTIDLNKYNLDDLHDKQVSAGKYAVIERLLKEDSTLTLEELSGTSVDDLIRYAVEKKIPVDELFDEYFDELEDKYDAKADRKDAQRDKEERAKEKAEELKERNDDKDKEDKDSDDIDDRDDDKDDADDDDDHKKAPSKKQPAKPAPNRNQKDDDDDDDRYEKEDDPDDDNDRDNNDDDDNDRDDGDEDNNDND